MYVCMFVCVHVCHTGEGLTVRTKSGKEVSADLAMLVIGVRPETSLAKAAGLELGPRGGIHVDRYMRTRYVTCSSCVLRELGLLIS